MPHLQFVVFFVGLAGANGVFENPSNEVTIRESLAQCVSKGSDLYLGDKKTLLYSQPTVEVQGSLSSFTVFGTEFLKTLYQGEKTAGLLTNLKKIESETLSVRFRVSPDYVIQVRSSEEIHEHIRKLKTFFWNPHRHFIVVSVQVFPHPLEVAQEIIGALWNANVLNAVALLSNPLNSSSFQVYSWFPFEQGNCGRNFSGIRIIDTCRHGRMHFKNNWFPNKIPRKLNNCLVNVHFMSFPPFVIGLKNNTILRRNYNHLNYGIEVNILNVIAETLNLVMSYVQEADWGDLYSNGTATGGLLGLVEERYDVMLGGYAKTQIRSLRFDATNDYLQEIILWCTPHVPVFTRLESLINILSYKVWILVLVLLISISIFMWSLGRGNPKEHYGYSDLINVFLINFAGLIGTAFKTLPRTEMIRFLMALFLIFSINLDSTILTYLTSIMSNPSFRESYETVQDIYKANLKNYFGVNFKKYIVADESIDDDFKQLIFERWNNCYNSFDCLNYVAFRRDSSFCTAKHFIDYVSSSYISKNRDPLIHTLKKPLLQYPVNVLMRKGFPLYKSMNGVIKWMLSTGLIEKWAKDSMSGKKNITLPEGYEDISTDPQTTVLTFKDLQPIFMLLLIGHFVGFVVFCFENLWWLKTKYKQ